MKFENTQVMNFKNALKGMRNPLNSWDKSDSLFCLFDANTELDLDVSEEWIKNKHPEYFYEKEKYRERFQELRDKYDKWFLENGIIKSENNLYEGAFIGPNDMNLAQRLIKAGSEHRKFMRQIFVSVDITAPLFWWKEADTYKIGTVANSTSTMHKIAHTPITLDCFEIDDYNSDLSLIDPQKLDVRISCFLEDLEQLRQKYLQTKDKKYWKELIRWLPEGWLQTRTITMNYENLLNICRQRENHKLTEWHQFIDWCKTLPYAKELIFYNSISK